MASESGERAASLAELGRRGQSADRGGKPGGLRRPAALSLRGDCNKLQEAGAISKFAAGGAVLALMLTLGGGDALGKHHTGGGAVDRACRQESFQRCLDKCAARGGKGKSSKNVQKCAKHCGEKTC
jgi:hypothetical protein